MHWLSAVLKKLMKKLKILSLLLSLFAYETAFADSAFSLLRNGWTILYEGYESVEECTPDEEPMRMGRYLVKCDGYEYPYHYGDVILFGRQITYEGNTLTLFRLCLGESDDDCMNVDVYRR